MLDVLPDPLKTMPNPLARMHPRSRAGPNRRSHLRAQSPAPKASTTAMRGREEMAKRRRGKRSGAGYMWVRGQPSASAGQYPTMVRARCVRQRRRGGRLWVVGDGWDGAPASSLCTTNRRRTDRYFVAHYHLHLISLRIHRRCFRSSSTAVYLFANATRVCSRFRML